MGANAILPAWLAAMWRSTVGAEAPDDFAKFYLGAGYPTAEARPAGSINVQPGVKVLRRLIRAQQNNQTLHHDFLKGRILDELTPQAGEKEALFTCVAMNRGTENNMTVLDQRGANSWDVVAPGQDGFAAPDGSVGPHCRDRMDLYDQFKHKPVLDTRQDVVKASTRVERLVVKRQARVASRVSAPAAVRACARP